MTDLPFAAGHDTPVQWVFDRTRGTGLERGQYLAVSLSCAREYIGQKVDELRAQFVPALEQLFPEAESARVELFFVTREQRATFRQGPGTAALRPGPRTRSTASTSPARGRTPAGRRRWRAPSAAASQPRARSSGRAERRSARGRRVTATLPETLNRARELVWPALALGRRHARAGSARGRRPPLRLGRGRRRRRQGGAPRPRARLGGRGRRPAGDGGRRSGRGRARPQLLAAPRRHHGSRPGAPPPPDGVDGVRRGARDRGAATPSRTSPTRCCCGGRRPRRCARRRSSWTRPRG